MLKRRQPPWWSLRKVCSRSRRGVGGWVVFIEMKVMFGAAKLTSLAPDAVTNGFPIPKAETASISPESSRTRAVTSRPRPRRSSG